MVCSDGELRDSAGRSLSATERHRKLGGENAERRREGRQTCAVLAKRAVVLQRIFGDKFVD